MRRVPALLGAALACACALSHPGHAYADSGSVVKVGDSSEAWYQTPPAGTCSSPVGCPPASPPSIYPKNTLHVGAFAGSQTAAAYVQPDLSGIPSGQHPVAGTMTLPLATTSGNGNTNAAAATVVACILTSSITDGTEGSTSTPPKSSCSVKATVRPGASAFTLDLGPFLAAWNSGRPEYGIALLADTSQPAAWHVAFNGRNLAGAPHITSSLTLAPDTAGGQGSIDVSGTIFASPSGASQAPAPTGLFNTGLFAAAPANGAPSIAAPASPAVPSIAAPPAAAATPRRASAAAPGLALLRANHGFQYPEILLLPLALVAGMVFALRLLTSDATPSSVARTRRRQA